MNTWAWLGAYLVGFVLLQVLVYYYFRRRTTDSSTTTVGDGSPSEVGGFEAGPEQEPAPHGSDGGGRLGGSAPPESDLDPDEAIRCGECGAYNAHDQMFLFCRNCGERLD
jgi:hypothetical protein